MGSIVALLLPCLELNCACGFQGCGLSSSLVFTSSKLQLQITFVKVGATFTMLIFLTAGPEYSHRHFNVGLQDDSHTLLANHSRI